MEHKKYPFMVKRYQSAFIDGRVLLILTYMFSVIFENIPNILWAVIGITFALVYLFHKPLFAARACALRQWITGIRLRSYSDAPWRIGYLQSVRCLSFKMLPGLFPIFTKPDVQAKRSLHNYTVKPVVF